MNSDDLLSFKEYSPVHESHVSTGRAEININSPSRQNTYRTPPTPSDPLEDLMGSMGTSVNVLHIEDRNMQINNNGDESDDRPRSHSFLSIEYYQQFFNVDTTMVLDRIASSMIPRRAPVNYLKQHIGSNPDLYGPFWIVVTLIFSIAISGNIASYLQEASNSYPWRYNFHLASIASTTIITYVCLIPLALWSAFKWFSIPADPDMDVEENGPQIPNLLTLMCIYGYSLAIYIPVSILWLIQVSFLQWLLVLTAAFLSGSVLIIVLSPALRNSQKSVILMSGILAAHFLLAAGFMLYFFHVPEHTLEATVVTVKTVVAGNHTS